MKIELIIDGEERVFTTPYVPYLAKRKYLKKQSALEEKIKKDENYRMSTKEQLDDDDEIVGIIADVVFNGQFTVDQVYAGCSEEYMSAKIREAIFGEPADDEDESGNKQGE